MFLILIYVIGLNKVGNGKLVFQNLFWCIYMFMCGMKGWSVASYMLYVVCCVSGRKVFWSVGLSNWRQNELTRRATVCACNHWDFEKVFVELVRNNTCKGCISLTEFTKRNCSVLDNIEKKNKSVFNSHYSQLSSLSLKDKRLLFVPLRPFLKCSKRLIAQVRISVMIYAIIS